MRALVLVPVAVALAACQADDDEMAATPPPPSIVTPAPPGTCPVIENREWAAWVNAMPGPNAVRTLHVTGQIVLPTPGYTITLVEGAADRSATPVQQLILTLTPPAGVVPQVLSAETVRFEGRAIAAQYRGVRIMCAGQMLTEITDVTIAQ
jgi:hypothetical protein